MFACQTITHSLAIEAYKVQVHPHLANHHGLKLRALSHHTQHLSLCHVRLQQCVEDDHTLVPARGNQFSRSNCN